MNATQEQLDRAMDGAKRADERMRNKASKSQMRYALDLHDRATRHGIAVKWERSDLYGMSSAEISEVIDALR